MTPARPRELLKGQNLPWPDGGLRVQVTGAACDLSAILLGDDDRVCDGTDLVLSTHPVGAGVTWSGGTSQRLDVDLARLAAPRVLCVASVGPDSPPIGALPPMRAVLDRSGAGQEAGGTAVATFPLTGLSTERAVVVCEVYRRAGAWKVRAVSQGYDGGLRELAARHGAVVEPSPDPPVPLPAPPPPPGTSDDERLYRHTTAIVEDAARSTASLRSSVAFAEQRRDGELSAALSDPRARAAQPTHDARRDDRPDAHRDAQRRYDELVTAARANHRRDTDQLRDELTRHVARLPAAMAPWHAPAWHPWHAPTTPGVALAVGDLHVPEAPDLRLPLLLRLPLRPPLWIDTGGDDAAGARMLRAVVTRLVATYPAGCLRVSLVDPTASATTVLAPLGRPGCPVVAERPASSRTEAGELLDRLAREVDLLHMASAADALDALTGTGDRVVVVHDFPFGLDEAAQARVRYLADDGPAVGVQVVLTAEAAPTADAGPLVSAVLRGAQRLPVTPDAHVTDRWTGTTWTFTPDLGPDDPRTVDDVLRRASTAR